jgi:hypothetical protein
MTDKFTWRNLARIDILSHPFGLGGTSNEPPVGLDNYGLPIARLRAVDEEIYCCCWVVVDHLSMAQCTGFTGSSFNEVQHVWSSV